MNILRTVFAAGFRPFFASCALYAIVFMAAWIGVFTFGWTMAGSQPNNWHAHEMIHGVVAAAIAGFLLTAVPKWTATRPVHGGPLVTLWLLWLAGRIGSDRRKLSVCSIMRPLVSLTVAGLTWITAFALFALLFFSKMMRPHADGQPGQ